MTLFLVPVGYVMLDDLARMRTRTAATAPAPLPEIAGLGERRSS
jgi:hypothetical protein